MHSNIIGFNPMLADITATQPRPFGKEVEQYLQRYPDTEHVDIYLNDLNGQFRGKRLPVAELFTLEKGCYFPLSIYAMDLAGQVIEESGLGQQAGEPDRLCLPVAGTLRPCARDPQHHAQLLLTMKNAEGEACELEPRVVLQQVLKRLQAKGYYPVIAAELEFYLHDPQQQPAAAVQCPTQSFSVDAPERHHALLNDIEHQARLQALPLTGVVAEAACGQYELNLHHSARVLEACDQVLALKRLTRQIAEKHHQHACFMAKPCAQSAGSGLHFHISLQDEQGNNLLTGAPGELSDNMQQAMAGMLALMPASMAILAPNVNAFRRFRPGMHVPLRASWGHNNRTVALRLPCADSANQRIEYRLAGADANPYLAVAVILGGLLHGLEQPLPLPPSTNGYENDSAAPLPLNQREALTLFRRCQPLRELLGPAFCTLWYTCKTAELRRFEGQVTATEVSWML
ncbi:glutamine synthetase family protein [Serratia quinivorans]|uniref:glutamine synthetase family protein n=1 Tax=Serratia quinivorans TaxID=137545 RepID=UPI002177C754|nr:glutamine synthetase family protein [Serratia quinivorans]CAI1059586.1 Gamma-glutamylputrescine synthetase PuuA [Serratia quinivorans]CAI2108311.1 Gamma-glutamylputrescine synthetase PuuA [Serratia quinivorans]